MSVPSQGETYGVCASPPLTAPPPYFDRLSLHLSTSVRYDQQDVQCGADVQKSRNGDTLGPVELNV